MTAPQYPQMLAQKALEHPPSEPPSLYSKPDDRWHPSFPSDDTDMTLRSIEGTLYGVYSYTLGKTCGFFATMFTLPRCATRPTLDVFESDSVLSVILALLFGLPIPTWGSLEQAESVLTVAEKWDAPGPIESIRSTIFVPRFWNTDPLRLYAIARHFEWDDEAKMMSSHTLNLNLCDATHSATLARIASKYLMPLFDLHQRRKVMFQELLDNPERFTAGNSEPYHCTRCGVTELDNHTWREYKQVLLLEIERRPSGDTIGLVSGGLSDSPEARACWDAKCTKTGCGGLNYDRSATLKQIKHCLQLLPVSIE